MENFKPAYEWALEKNLRIVGLESNPVKELEFYTIPIEEDVFENFIGNLTSFDGMSLEEDKLHLKSEKYLELRMYSLVPYNILGIQMGIQHEHSVNEYVRKHVIEQIEFEGGTPCEKYVRWVKHWKTSILLNGGTTNEGRLVTHGYGQIEYLGSMQSALHKLLDNDIKLSAFYEPDLNNALTGISFIVDERVFNRKLYEDFVEMTFEDLDDGSDWCPDDEEIYNINQKRYKDWLEVVGGEQNAFLRDFLRNFKLARG